MTLYVYQSSVWMYMCVYSNIFMKPFLPTKIAREQGIAEEFYESKRPYYRHRLDWDVKTTFDIKPSLRNSSVRLEDVGSFIQMEWNLSDQPYTYAQKTGRYPPNSGQIAKHVLKGPYNPLEASFLSLTSVGQSR